MALQDGAGSVTAPLVPPTPYVPPVQPPAAPAAAPAAAPGATPAPPQAAVAPVQDTRASTGQGIPDPSAFDNYDQAAMFKDFPDGPGQPVRAPNPVAKAANKDQALDNLQKAQGVLAADKKHNEELDKDLDQAMTLMGPGLTADQKEAFIKNFKAQTGPDGKPAYKDLEADRVAITNQLDANQAYYAEMVGNPEPAPGGDMPDWPAQARESILSGYAEAAKSQTGYEVAAAFSEQVAGMPHLSGQDAKFIQDNVAGVAAARMVEDGMNAGETPDKASSGAEAFLDKIQEKFGKNPGDAKDLAGSVGKLRTALGEVMRGTTNASLERIKELHPGFGYAGDMLATLGLATAPLRIKETLDQGRFDKLTKEVLSDAQAGSELAEHFLKNAARVSQQLDAGAEVESGAIKVAEGAGKFFGVAAAAVGAVSDLHDHKFAGAIGNVLMGVGTFIPPPAGPLVEVAGTALVLYQEFKQEHPSGESLDRWKTALDQTFKDSDPSYGQQLDRLNRNHPGQLRKVGSELQLTPEQIQKAYHQGFSTPLFEDGAYGDLRSVATVLAGGKPGDIQGNQVSAYLDGLAKDHPDPASRNQAISDAHAAIALIQSQNANTELRPPGFWAQELRKLADPAQDPTGTYAKFRHNTGAQPGIQGASPLLAYLSTGNLGYST